MTPSAKLLHLSLAAALCSAVACSSQSSRITKPSDPEDRRITTARTAPIPRAAPGPIVSGEAIGIEVHWWIADNARAEIPRALEPYIDDPEPIPADLRARWNAAGLRIVRIPLADLPAIERAATPLSERNRTWHHAAGIWVEFFRAKHAATNSGAFKINRRHYKGPPGVLRFIGRTSIVPTNQRTAAIRLELAAQVHRNPTAADDVFRLPTAITPLQQGRVFDHLTLRADLLPGFAYVITSETPGVSWRDEPPTEDDTDPRDLQPDPPAPSPSASFGPAARAIPSLGQALLAVPPASRSGSLNKPAQPTGRILLVLIPRAPENYSLLR